MNSYYSTINEIIELIKSPQLQSELLPAKVIFIFFSVFFFVSIIYLMFTSSYLKNEFIIDVKAFFAWQSASLQKITKRWKKIQKRIETGTEQEYKLAVIEADDLLRDVLDEKGFTGKTFEERIKQIEKTQLPNLDEILEAHKIRNSIVYDPDYKLDSDRAKQILEFYDKGIKSVEPF